MVENINNRKTLKNYTNPPKIIGLLSILHEQFKFYVPQHGRALVPCRLVWGRMRPQNQIPRTQNSLSPKFQFNSTSTFRDCYFNLSANCLPAKTAYLPQKTSKVILTLFHDHLIHISHLSHKNRQFSIQNIENLQITTSGANSSGLGGQNGPKGIPACEDHWVYMPLKFGKRPLNITSMGEGGQDLLGGISK